VLWLHADSFCTNLPQECIPGAGRSADTLGTPGCPPGCCRQRGVLTLGVIEAHGVAFRPESTSGRQSPTPCVLGGGDRLFARRTDDCDGNDSPQPKVKL
jgi:hypothetical protein